MWITLSYLQTDRSYFPEVPPFHRAAQHKNFIVQTESFNVQHTHPVPLTHKRCEKTGPLEEPQVSQFSLNLGLPAPFDQRKVEEVLVAGPASDSWVLLHIGLGGKEGGDRTTMSKLPAL